MKVCPECSSEKVIKDALLIEAGYHHQSLALGIVVYEKPDAMLFKQAVHTSTRAEVCGDCGYIRSFSTDPKRLWFAYQSRDSVIQ